MQTVFIVIWQKRNIDTNESDFGSFEKVFLDEEDAFDAVKEDAEDQKTNGTINTNDPMFGEDVGPDYVKLWDSETEYLVLMNGGFID